MHIIHIALGGCLKPQPVRYGLTGDTGGHIAYVLAAAEAQAKLPHVSKITIVTRAFDDASLGEDYGLTRQAIGERVEIVRLRTACRDYLSKEALVAELPALQTAFLRYIGTLDVAPTVCHAHFADAAQLALAARRVFSVPFLFTPHSLALDKAQLQTRTDKALSARIERERTAIAKADGIIISSSDERDNQLAAYDAADDGTTHILPPGSTLECADETRAAEELLAPHLDSRTKPMILAIARPVNKKNLVALVHAYGQDKALQRAANLVVVAGQHACIRKANDEQAQNLDELFALRRHYELEGRFALPPAHNQQIAAQLYRMAARNGGVFVNPAQHEPFGLTLLEAAHAGLPLVATCHGGPSDIIAKLQAGSLVEPDDHVAIAEACRSYIGDPEHRARTVETARGNLAQFSWGAWARNCDAIIADLPALRAAPGPDYLLACDMDDTLTGSAASGLRFYEWRKSGSARGVHFAIATGREVDDAIEVHRRWRLPMPDVWITSVGSEIHRRRANGTLEQCADYSAFIESGWERAETEMALVKVGGTLQPLVNQRDHKISFFGDAQEAARLERILRDLHIEAKVIASHGRFIDVLPPKAGKGAAVLFEAERIGVDADNVISAGNSGNDIELLTSASHAIVVANALPELTLASEHRDLYRSHLPYADGVLDGVSRALAARRPHAPRAVEAVR